MSERRLELLRSASFIEIGRNVWIGTQAIVLRNVRFGEGAIIGTGIVVTQDVPPFALCADNPRRLVRTLRKTGHSAKQ
jgi:acetyltransferase-like isoleucine patch superfamily enzyme